LTFDQVWSTFHKLSGISGNNSVNQKEEIIVKICQEGTNMDAKYIIRWLGKNLGTGAAEKTILAALARAVAYSPPNRPKVRN